MNPTDPPLQAYQLSDMLGRVHSHVNSCAIKVYEKGFPPNLHKCLGGLSRVLSIISVPSRKGINFEEWMGKVESLLENISEKDWEGVILPLRQAEKDLIRDAKRKHIYGYAPIKESLVEWYCFFPGLFNKK